MSKGTVNKVIVLGRLGNDPDVRSTAAGTTVTTLSIATNTSVKDQQGNWSDRAEWHRVILFGKMADNAAQYLRKGSQVYIEGRLQTNKWQDQQGNDRYTTEIVANEMQFIGGMSDQQQSNGQQASGAQNRNQTPQQNYQQQAPQQQQATASDFSEDIPF